MLEALNAAAILVSGTMVGNEFAIATFVHPSFTKIADSAHAAAASSIARLLGRVMPFWYALVLLLSVADAALRWRSFQQLDTWLLVSSALWGAAIVYTVIWLVPINNRVGSWTPDFSPPGWREDRKQW